MTHGQVVWFEIPVTNLDRAIDFYSKVLDTRIDKVTIVNQDLGIINKDSDVVRGALIVKENHQPGIGSVLYFYVADLYQSLKTAEGLGATILLGKTLLKQKTNSGHLTINANLIDGRIGYISELIDCEGNRICLYSNS